MALNDKLLAWLQTSNFHAASNDAIGVDGVALNAESKGMHVSILGFGYIGNTPI